MTGFGYNVNGFGVSGGAKNLDPIITSSPVTAGTMGVAYSYQVQATDPEGGSLAYSLPTKPTGMTISVSGLVQWTPSSLSSESVVVRVTDNKGAFAEQSYSIAVVAPPAWANNNSRPYIASQSGPFIYFAVPITNSSTSPDQWQHSNNGGSSWSTFSAGATIVTPTTPFTFNGTVYAHYARSKAWGAGSTSYIQRFGFGGLFGGETSRGENAALSNNAGNFNIATG